MESYLPGDRTIVAVGLGTGGADVPLPSDIRRTVYRTDAIESLSMKPLKVSKNRPLSPSDEAASKLLYFAVLNLSNRLQIADPKLPRGAQPARYYVRQSSSHGPAQL